MQFKYSYNYVYDVTISISLQPIVYVYSYRYQSWQSPQISKFSLIIVKQAWCNVSNISFTGKQQQHLLSIEPGIFWSMN